MRRLLAVLIVLAVLAAAGYAFFRQSLQSRNVGADTIAVYYCKTDGETLVPWKVTLGPARDRKSVAFYAATQALAGPPPNVEAIRFPAGSAARSVNVTGDTATVDLNRTAGAAPDGSFAESGEFKALVWTLTALPGIDKVQVEIEGLRVPNLPGGHLELDQPLARANW